MLILLVRSLFKEKRPPSTYRCIDEADTIPDLLVLHESGDVLDPEGCQGQWGLEVLLVEVREGVQVGALGPSQVEQLNQQVGQHLLPLWLAGGAVGTFHLYDLLEDLCPEELVDVLGSVDCWEELAGVALSVECLQRLDRQGQGGGGVVLKQVQQVLAHLPQAVCTVQLHRAGTHVAGEV